MCGEKLNWQEEFLVRELGEERRYQTGQALIVINVYILPQRTQIHRKKIDSFLPENPYRSAR